ncbi:hypothetical protein EG328_007062 [Venturia inaequalis]|uniref:Uncharacterized protein n=1 Tax=Venturia inaequalis TaxID=5025 RepID=A0A8H3UH43_VENIN|nr:hypothetical protein EG328_007062 [Venturia inaequalis]RDI88994.1 hypothetical protein Vi05172_g1493 [Venturia inaequalis]
MEYHPTAFPFYQGRWRDHVRENTQNNPHLRGKRGGLAFVWPRDGKRNTTFGRLKDVLGDKGPDIFVTKNGARPLKTSWTNRRFTTPDDPDAWLRDDTRKPMFWAKRGADESYDFRTRKYGETDRFTWTDALWMQPTGRKGEHQSKQNYPLAYKCSHGRWYQMYPNQRGDHGGFNPGADNHGPGFSNHHFAPGDWGAGNLNAADGNFGYGHRVHDHMDTGLNFHEDDRWEGRGEDDLNAFGDPMNFWNYY